MAWTPTAVKYNNGGGGGGGTTMNLSFLFGTAPPYTGAFLVTTIVTHTTCSSVTDSAHGAHTKAISVAQSDGLGELSIWYKGPFDYAAGYTITVTCSAGADTSMNGSTVIMLPGGGDTLYTGGVLNHTGSNTGTQSANGSYNVTADVVCDSGTQYMFTFGSSNGTNHTVDESSGVGGSPGDLNGITSYWGNNTVGSWSIYNSEIWIPVTPLGTGTRSNLYASSTTGTGTFGWASAGVSFTKPAGAVSQVLTNPGGTPNRLSFSGTLTPVWTNAHPSHPIVVQRRSIKN